MGGKNASLFALFVLLFCAFLFWLQATGKLRPVLQTITGGGGGVGGGVPTAGTPYPSPGAAGSVPVFVRPPPNAFGSMTPGVQGNTPAFGLAGLANSFLAGDSTSTPQMKSGNTAQTTVTKQNAKGQLTDAAYTAAANSGNPYAVGVATLGKALGWRF